MKPGVASEVKREGVPRPLLPHLVAARLVQARLSRIVPISPQHYELVAVLEFMAYLGLTMAIVTATYYAVERPFLAMKRGSARSAAEGGLPEPLPALAIGLFLVALAEGVLLLKL